MLYLLYYLLGIIIIALIGYFLYKHYSNSKIKEIELNTQSYIDQAIEVQTDNQHLKQFQSFPSESHQAVLNYNLQNQKKNASILSQKSQQSSSRLQNSSILLNKNIPLFQADEKRNEQVQQIINNLYDKSTRTRKIEEQHKYFLGFQFEFPDLCKEYNIKKLTIKQKLKKICQAYVNVRGDGNCFYTAFGYQFLEILLFKYSNDKFYKFIKNIQFDIRLPFSINLNDQIEINNIQEESFRKEFIFRLEQLKSIQNVDKRRKMLFEGFKAYRQENEEYDGCFYALSTIFFRNLSIHALEKNELNYIVTDKQNLLIWEKECNNNEIVIQSLSNFLELYIQLIFFTNEDFQLIEYGPQYEHKILLLIRPGHYNIGIPPG